MVVKQGGLARIGRKSRAIGRWPALVRVVVVNRTFMIVIS